MLEWVLYPFGGVKCMMVSMLVITVTVVVVVAVVVVVVIFPGGCIDVVIRVCVCVSVCMDCR